MEVAEILARVGEQQDGAAGDPLPDHLKDPGDHDDLPDSLTSVWR